VIPFHLEMSPRDCARLAVRTLQNSGVVDREELLRMYKRAYAVATYRERQAARFSPARRTIEASS